MRTAALTALAVALVAAATAAVLVRGAEPQAASASSHREAPLIAEDPSADATDLYAFRSPDRPDTVTIVGNWIPARGSGRRPQLVHVLAAREVPAPHRPHRGREARGLVPLPLPDEGPGRVPRQHGPDLQRHPHRGRPLHRDRGGPRDAAEQHRPALDPELPRPRGGRRPRPPRRRQGLRRAAGRRVLRRHRGDLRPRRHPQRHRRDRRRAGLLRRLRRALDRAAAPDRRARHLEPRHRRLDVDRAAAGVGAGVEAGAAPVDALGAGLAPRQPADQRGDHPDAA